MDYQNIRKDTFIRKGYMTSNEESILKNMISYTFTVYDLTYLYVEFTLDKLPDISKQFTFSKAHIRIHFSRQPTIAIIKPQT